MQSYSQKLLQDVNAQLTIPTKTLSLEGNMRADAAAKQAASRTEIDYLTCAQLLTTPSLLVSELQQRATPKFLLSKFL